jgi:4-diphosphocytidyl-2-C-methyl-D-erythritol kinase
LEKRIPMGAGLGGGSSNAVAALRGLNSLAGEPLGGAELAAVAARLGSDCALFLPGGPVVMRGRGERVEPLAAETAERLRGQRMLIFKPDFSISTPWAYAQLAADGGKNYLPAAEAEARLAAWLGEAKAPLESLLFNSFERPAFGKFPALPVLLDALNKEFGLSARMSGSGSACFALLPADAAVEAVKSRIREAWGATAGVVETRIS